MSWVRSADGHALLAEVERLAPDVVVTDIGMPGLDGIEASRRILARNAATRVVLVTVHTDPALVERGLAAGALGYVVKRVAGDALVPAIRSGPRGQTSRDGRGGARRGRNPERTAMSSRKTDDARVGGVARRPQAVACAAAGRGEGRTVVGADMTELEETKAALQKSLREVEALKERLEAQNVVLQQQVRHAQDFDEIVGTSAPLGRVLAQVERVAPTDAPVLLLGETGTGKELVARALHERSRRRERPLVTVNCAALPATLVESELFGYEKGAFTGAIQRTVGRFEVAHGGSLFLDEIGELPLEVQAKLLRVLQTGEFERLGSPKTIKVDVRLIAATNRDLAREVREGRFRADLFYRLNVFPIALPPLRERREDIPLLVWHAITRRQAAIGRSVKHVPERLMRAFTAYSWPGNVRELENVVERALIMTSGDTLAADPAFLDAAPVVPEVGPRASLAEAERAHIRAVLDDCGWKISGKGNAADRLGLNRSTLQFRMKKLGIERPGNGGSVLQPE